MKIPSFYIKNFRDGGQESDLEKLLKNGTQKIVFRLLQESNELLSLVAFSGKKNHKKFNEGVELKLNRYPSGREVDLNNLQVFLGDMEIGSQEDSAGIDPISELKKMANKPQTHEKYIIVEPIMPQQGDRYILYQLFALPDLDNQFRSASRSSGITANPSPPHDGY